VARPFAYRNAFRIGAAAFALVALACDRPRRPAPRVFDPEVAPDRSTQPVLREGGGSTIFTPPATAAAARAMGVLDRIDRNLRTSVYRHELRVNEREGRYEFDCSAMAAWVLSRSAPRALSSVGSGRVLAADFVRAIERAPDVVAPRSPVSWQRVTRIADARPGDVLAWRRPPWFPSRNTGHVAFVTAAPVTFEQGGGYLVRIADASSFQHEADSRANTGRTGFGFGTLLVTTDPTTGQGTGYGWAGRYSTGYVVATNVVIGRPMR
jgi:hypothetical protein